MFTAIQSSLRQSAEVLHRLAESTDTIQALAAVAQACVQSLQAGGKILLAGNGGSAADCQHIAGELVARFNFDRPGLSAVALTVDSSVLTAIGNDYGYERVFARQVEALGVRGDVLFAYTTSGGSPNILAAIDAARQRGLIVVGITGAKPSAMLDGRCHHLLQTPAAYTPHIQEGHLVMGHLLCQLIEDAMFGSLRPEKA